jgi:hypothetical protein
MECQTVFPDAPYVNTADIKWNGPFGETHVVGDIPIDFRGTYGGAPGITNNQIHHVIDWAEKHGVLRQNELEPISNPAILINDIEQSGIFQKKCNGKQRESELMSRLVRWQIFSVMFHNSENIDDIVYSSGDPWNQVLGSDLLDTESWRHILEKSEKMEWNAMTEMYADK